MLGFSLIKIDNRATSLDEIMATEQTSVKQITTELRSTPNRPSIRKRITSVLRHVVLISAVLIFLLPFYWMVISSLKENTMVFSNPVQWYPDPIRWRNFIEALDYPGFPFLKFLWNSTYYAGFVTIGTVISCSMAGYAFARLRYPGKNLFFSLTVASLMIPGIITFIPVFLFFKNLGWLGTYLPLIVPAFFGNAFFIFMMRQFFFGLPEELADAARVDGAGEIAIFFRIMLPLVKPALLVTAVFTFLWTWHEFFGPLIYLSNQDQYPLSLGLYAFRGRRITEWGLMMAGAVLTTLPLVILFFIAQRYFLEGIKLSGLKG
jgi:multiple sugar transport system permease protein